MQSVITVKEGKKRYCELKNGGEAYFKIVKIVEVKCADSRTRVQVYYSLYHFGKVIYLFCAPVFSATIWR